MRILMTVLFAATLSLFMGCASVPAGRPSGLRFYTFDDSGTGLIRAFQDENTTVLQFVNLEGETFVIFDGEGQHLKYERVGEHYVILPGTYSSLTVRMVTRNASVNITGTSDKTVEKRKILAGKPSAVPRNLKLRFRQNRYGKKSPFKTPFQGLNRKLRPRQVRLRRQVIAFLPA